MPFFPVGASEASVTSGTAGASGSISSAATTGSGSGSGSAAGTVVPVGSGMAAGAPAPPVAVQAELTEEEAVRLACLFYDTKGPFVGKYRIATPVLGAYFNSSGGGGGTVSCEWSLRYYVMPSTGEQVRPRFI